ncbi:TetR/AcrR family transcriptional regulator [Sphingomonas cavernae]|nr:TetR/AcrR family transcriptional regulator [Sphingomonas cavernae]
MLVQAVSVSPGLHKPQSVRRRRGCGRAVILDVARRLLRERSLDGLSMELVAQEAGYTRRTIYNHFASVTELFEVSRKSLIAGLEPLVPNAITSRLPMTLALSRFATQASRLFADDRHLDLMLSAIRDRHASSWIANAYDTAIQRPLSDALIAFLDEAQAAGSFNGNSRSAAFQLLWTLQAAATSTSIFNSADTGARSEPDAIVRAFLMQHHHPDAMAA